MSSSVGLLTKPWFWVWDCVSLLSFTTKKVAQHPCKNLMFPSLAEASNSISKAWRLAPSNSHHQDCYGFSRGSQPKPSLATVTGRGDNPMDHIKTKHDMLGGFLSTTSSAGSWNFDWWYAKERELPRSDPFWCIKYSEFGRSSAEAMNNQWYSPKMGFIPVADQNPLD